MMPPVGYFGAKARIAPQIAALLPAHGHYVEPFAGSLTVLLAKAPSHMETVNDLDGDLITFWRVLRDRPADLEAACALTPHSRAEHQAAYQPADDELERARRVWVLLTQGRARIMRPTGWRHHADPSGSDLSMPGYLRGYVARITPAAARLAMVSLESRPALEVIAAYGRHPGTLIYADPPYPASTRPNSASTYRHEMNGDTEHAELAAALRACRGAVVISGYNCPLYDELYAGWDRHEIRAYSGYGTGNKTRTEVLWSNRPLATPRELTLFDAEDSEGAA
jgi:DNA adenine methylase